MLKTLDKLKIADTPKRYVLMLYVFLNCLLSASGQCFSNYEIVELININVLQIDILAIENLKIDKLGNWILSNGNSSLVMQGGSNNNTLIEQVRGVGNTARVLQQGHHNRVGFEYADERRSGIYQSKSRNYSQIEQFGNQNRSETFQHGNCNGINIVQHGATAFFIDYRNSLNNVVVSQTGYGNSSTVKQTFYP